MKAPTAASDKAATSMDATATLRSATFSESLFCKAALSESVVGEVTHEEEVVEVVVDVVPEEPVGIK